MQEEDSTSDFAVNLAVALRQDGNRLWSYRCHREAEMQLAAYHVQDQPSNEEELITEGLLSIESSMNNVLTGHQEDEIKESRRPTDINEEIGASVADVAIGNTDLYSEEEDVRTMKTVSKEETMILREETMKMWQFRTLVKMENCYHEQLTLIRSTAEHHEVSEDEQSPTTKWSYKEFEGSFEDVVTSDSEQSFHSLEEFIPNELIDSGSDYDDAKRTLCESIGVQTTATVVYDAASQTIDTSSHSVCVQTEGAHLLDASTNTVTMTTNDVSTNTIITTDDAATNTVTMVTVDSVTNTVAMELVDVATNTTPKTTNDAIIQTDKLLVSRSQSEYESLIDKYKKYIEALKTEVTQEKSQRLVAEQMVTIVQSEVENLRQRNIDLTSQQIKLENELSETKVMLVIHSQNGLTVLLEYINSV